MNRYVIGFIVASVLTLVALLFIQSHKIDGLKADLTEAQQQALELTSQNIILEQNLAAEKSAVEKQAELTTQYRKTAEDKRESVRYVLKNTPCYNTAIDSAALEQLRK